MKRLIVIAIVAASFVANALPAAASVPAGERCKHPGFRQAVCYTAEKHPGLREVPAVRSSAR